MITKEIWLQNIAYLIMFLFLIMIIPLHLFTCFISGFLIYEIIISLTPKFEKFFNSKHARWIIVSLIAIVMIIILTSSIIGIISLLKEDLQGEINITSKIDRIFANVKNSMPKCLPSFLPESTKELKEQIYSLIESNVILIRNMGHTFLHGIITLFLGLIIGAVISLSKPLSNKTYFTKQLLKRIYYLSQAFRNIVFAQIKISILNTLLTATIILIILPLCNIHLPLGKTLIFITFIFGLLPIIGNLLSNTIIIISALSISLTICIMMIVYLIFIHKLEYFLNAEIIGSSIQARPWELMLAMLILESTFGLEGLVAAPIYYAYLKTEMRIQKII